MHIPRYPFDLAARAQGRLSPRKRGCGRLGMTKERDGDAALKGRSSTVVSGGVC